MPDTSPDASRVTGAAMSQAVGSVGTAILNAATQVGTELVTAWFSKTRGSAKYFYHDAIRCFNEGRFAEAASLANKADKAYLRLRPTKGSWLHWVPNCDEIVESESERAELAGFYFFAATLSFLVGEFIDADKQIKQSLFLAGKNALYLELEGRIALVLKKSSLAIESLQESYRLHPTHEIKTYIYYLAHQPRELLADYKRRMELKEKAEEKKPEPYLESLAHSPLIAWAYMTQEQYQAAAMYFMDCILLIPEELFKPWKLSLANFALICLTLELLRSPEKLSKTQFEELKEALKFIFPLFNTEYYSSYLELHPEFSVNFLSTHFLESFREVVTNFLFDLDKDNPSVHAEVSKINTETFEMVTICFNFVFNKLNRQDLINLRLAAPWGLPLAQTELAFCLSQGFRFKQNLEQAIICAKAAILTDEALALVCLGKCYALKPDEAGVSAVLKKVKQNTQPLRPEVMTELEIFEAQCVLDQTDASQHQKALLTLSRFAYQGIIGAQRRLAEWYFTGEKNPSSALRWVDAIIANADPVNRYEYAMALCLKARIIAAGKMTSDDAHKVYVLLNKARKLSCMEGDRLLALFCKSGLLQADGRLGNNVPTQEDLKLAFNLFMSLHKNGFLGGEAEYQLGLCFFRCEGVPFVLYQNRYHAYQMAKYFFNLAIEKGYLQAHEYLGIMSYHGQGAEKSDLNEALKHLQLVEHLPNNSQVLYYLGLIYSFSSTLQDSATALRYFSSPALTTYLPAQQRLHVLFRSLSNVDPTLQASNAAQLTKLSIPRLSSLSLHAVSNRNGKLICVFNDLVAEGTFGQSIYVGQISQREQISWSTPPVRISPGYTHCRFTLNNKDQCILLAQKGTELYWALGSLLTDNPICFSTFTKYDTGKQPAIAMNDSNVIVEVHDTERGSHPQYTIGILRDGNIYWHIKAKGISYKHHLHHPSVAIEGDWFVIVSENKNKIHCCIGHLKPDLNIEWGETLIELLQPLESLHILMHYGEVFISGKAAGNKDGGLYLLRGKLNQTSRTVLPAEGKWLALPYDIGDTPSLFLANRQLFKMHSVAVQESPQLSLGELQSPAVPTARM